MIGQIEVIFSKTKSMIGVGFKALARTPVPQLPPSYPPPPPRADYPFINQYVYYFLFGLTCKRFEHNSYLLTYVPIQH